MGGGGCQPRDDPRWRGGPSRGTLWCASAARDRPPDEREQHESGRGHECAHPGEQCGKLSEPRL